MLDEAIRLLALATARDYTPAVSGSNGDQSNEGKAR